MKRSTRTGWGRNLVAQTMYRSLDRDNPDIAYQSEESSSGLAVGMGRSYGDSSLISNGTTWTTEKLNKLEIIPDLKIAVCDSGVTVGQLERAASKLGLFPYVVPGTEFVTIGGAIASNVHGKSHHADGSFGDYVLEISIVNQLGNISVLTPHGDTSELFWATLGEWV